MCTGSNNSETLSPPSLVTPTNDGAWTAWYRPSGRLAPWKLLATGATEAEALLASHRMRLGGDWLVLRGGPESDPNRDERRGR